MSEARRSGQLPKLAFLIALTVALVLFPVPPRDERATLPMLFTAVALNFTVAGWIVTINRLVPFPPWRIVYETRPFERRIYEFLGVKRFRSFLELTHYRRLWGPSVKRGGGRISLEELADDMRESEISHSLGFFIVGALSFYLASVGRDSYGLVLMACNLFINGYPVMLQRYNRDRIDAILTRARRIEA